MHLLHDGHARPQAQPHPGEIVAQVHAVNREVRELEDLEAYRSLSNLVFMGMGEPTELP